MEDVKLTLRKSENTDWYCIERAEHDGRTWLKPIDGGAQFICAPSRRAGSGARRPPWPEGSTCRTR